MDKVLFFKNKKKICYCTLLTNLIVIVLAVGKMGFINDGLIYWFQSVIIGLFQVKNVRFGKFFHKKF